MPVTRNFTFHACLGPTSRQQDVLRLCGITQLLDASLDGYNSTVLAYGQTGSGKTFTMAGREDALLAEGYMGDSDDGIVARSLDYLFKQAARRSSSDGCRYSLRVSFAEIYNEQIYDLIRFDKKPLQVRWDAAAGFHAPELLKQACTSLEEALQVLSMAVRHRRVGSHELNMESSRSHSIFTAYIDCTPTRADDHEFGMTRYGKVSFVDLAGSERLRDSKSAGETFKETTNINRSLFMLGKVIAALADGAQGARVPYRESKLTKLLMDSLGGSSLSLLIACCSPSATHFEETLSTLSYASRAKNIRNRPAVQVDPEQAALAALKREVKLLRSENAVLRDTVEQLLQEQRAAGAGALPTGSMPNQTQPPGTASTASYAMLPPGSISFAPPGVGQAPGAAVVGSRPATGSGSAAAAAPSGGPTPSSEELMRRLLDTQRMLVQFSRENDRLAGENGRLRTGKTLVANDYADALNEVDWLKLKLETLEAALLSGSLDSGLLAALEGGSSSMSRAEVLEAARAAVQSAVLQPGKALQQGLPEGGSQQDPPGGLLSLEPLASQLASAALTATAAVEAAAGGQSVGGPQMSEVSVVRLSSHGASIQAERAMPADTRQAEKPQPTILNKAPLIERLLISEGLETPASCAAGTGEEAALPMDAAAEVPAVGVTATVLLVGSALGSKGSASEAVQAKSGVDVAGDAQL
ncbi:kinesin motor catalytic domain [Chlorella sorokiniana]|uniref:Kinesin-like protein n=1 Tax=Chlorella sorokiniana TaxID=3076 RepID=A0A2P6U5A2_CHLSO|nr:kinesin motor catalytic domain [Chlorella sorokiniana]|eukprot:PRW61495.1 kinesin motor catalytic domain [Chlorella sorokiniana]